MSHAFNNKGKQRKKWFSQFEFSDSPRTLEETIEVIKTFEYNNVFSDDLIIIISIQDLRPLYISKNVRKTLGYTQEEFVNSEESIFFKIGAIDQPNYFNDIAKWVLDFSIHSPISPGAYARFHLCGVRFKHKDENKTVRFFSRMEVTVNPDLSLPEFAILFNEDVTHLLKADNDHWKFVDVYGNDKPFRKFYRVDGMDKYPIRSREQEVLRLIAEGKGTKETAEILNISPDTVAQHRKNMIKRLMAKDTSALIQLCKMCDII